MIVELDTEVEYNRKKEIHFYWSRITLPAPLINFMFILTENSAQEDEEQSPDKGDDTW